MTPEEEKKLLEKLDAMTAKIELLENPHEEEEKNDVDPRIEKAEALLRTSLKGSFSDEKLAEMKFDALEIAMQLKTDFKPPVGIIPPTGGGTQKEDAYTNIPDGMRAHFGSDDNYGELIK